MKKNLFFFAMLGSVVVSAQTSITVAPISTTYTGTPTVQFSVSWANSSRNATHNSKVWVFIDFRTVTNNVPSGSWARALISGTPTATTGTPSRETGNDKGFWLQGTSGSSGTYNAIVTVKLSGVPAKFNWCAYVSDYPPNAVSYSSGTYNTLKGTLPFTITGNGTIQGNKYVGSIINSMTDATGCPGGVGRDEVHNGGTCAPGLTAVGNYCRDLTADDAFALTCSGNTIEVKNSDAGTALWANRDLCSSSGWRVAGGRELKCICQQVGLSGYYNAANYDYYDDNCETSGYPAAAWLVPEGKICEATISGSVGTCGVIFERNQWVLTSIAKIRCVR